MERLIEIGKVKPLAKTAKKCDKFGIGLEKLDREVFDPNKTYDKLQELGMKYVRLQSGWMRTEKEEGVYDFAWLDDIVDNLIKRGMQPWFCLCYGNPIYTESAKEAFGGVGCPPIFTEREKNAWAKYVQATALHFQGRVNIFEVWNEPDGIWCWKHGVSGKEYGEFCRDTGKAIKEVCPTAEILGGSACCWWGHGFVWLEQALQTGMGAYIDGLTYHEYTVDERSALEITTALKAILKRYGDIKLVQGEAGSPSSSRGHGALHRGAFTPLKQAKLLLRRQVVDLMTEVEFSSVFTTVDMIEALNGTNGDVASYLDYGYFGLLGASFDENGFSTGEYTPKPSYYAYQNFLSIMGETASLCDIPTIFLPCFSDRYCSVDESRKDLLFACFEKKNGAKAMFYWKPSHLLKESFEGVTTFQTTGTSGAVRLTDPMTGKVYALPEDIQKDLGYGVTAFKHLPVLDYPLVLTFGDFFEVNK